MGNENLVNDSTVNCVAVDVNAVNDNIVVNDNMATTDI